MTQVDRQRSVHELLSGFRGLEPLKKLFWSELNYQRINEPLSRRGWSDTTASALAEDPLLFAGGGKDNDFHVICARLSSERLLLSHERPVVSRLLREHPYALFIFSNSAQDRWHFLNVKYDAESEKRRLFRRITIGPEERLRTASERIALLDLESIRPDLFGLSPLTIQQQHDEAFDVEAVTKQFFEEYKAVFAILQDDLTRQTKDRTWAHDYALQFLNRCMFLYFVQRKSWLGKDTEFLRSFWESYKNSGQARDSFFERWLKVLFFEAFNNSFQGGHRHFPDEIRQALAMAPYLNGGLFTQNDIDRKSPFIITDKSFQQVFNFLERYNFTIAEDSPLDKEVAVDPEMIGKVYEGLVNVSIEADERGEAGIFYTPRTEIDLMCRLALVDYLSNHLGKENKNLLYELVFALETDEKDSADKELAKAKLWPVLDSYLREITVLDPACGSGSFLVGILYILDDLEERANKHLGRNEKAYERKKRIIGQNLYGVDVMDWACHVAELRLWLALTVDADFTREELHVRKEPLLPHFTFKIRCGDSLVQEAGGINLSYIRGSTSISPALKERIARLKAEKLKFYNNDSTCKFRTPQQAMQEELRIFREILDTRHHDIQEEIKVIRRKIEGPSERQMRLDGSIEGRTHQMELQAVEWKKKVGGLESDLDRIDQARSTLKTIKDVPFVWDIAFVEIFEGSKKGFDIVIGNPPYVERHKIRDPRSPLITDQPNRKLYMSKLVRSVYEAFPRYFHLKASGETARSISAMSDLYIYFYFLGLSLLNFKGAFCFITSNSWLDVGYGADLQEFLLKHCHVKMVLDNQARRSFASADVNTVMALFSSPDVLREWALDQTARFVMFKVPFEHILSPVIFEEIESANERKTTKEYRVHPIGQKALLEDAWEWPEDTTEEMKQRFGLSLKGSRYGGNKWGGKYLRAPDIYHIIREKGSLAPINSLAKARLGVTTGANEFFFIRKLGSGRYITTIGGAEREFEFPDKFAQPIIRTVSECKNITFRASATDWRIVVLPEAITDLEARAYVKLGERAGVPHRPFFRGKKCWYTLSFIPADTIAVPEIVFARYFFLWNENNCILNKNFYGFVPGELDLSLLWGLLNCSYSFLQFELSSRKPGAGASGISVNVANRSLVLSPRFVGKAEQQAIKLSGKILRNSPIREVWDDFTNPERRSLDNIIFDVLGLTKGERDAVYEEVINLVEARLKKAESLRPKERRIQPEMAGDIKD